MELKNKKILVTGACGFIGSHLVEELVNNDIRIRAFVFYNSDNRWVNLELLPEEIKKKLEIFPGDIHDSMRVKEAIKGCQVVFHLASLISIPYSYVNPESYVTTNVNGTLNVLQACREYNIEKVIFISSSEVYGTAQYVPIDEKHPLQAQSPYSATKIAAEKLCESFFRSFNLPVCIVRPFNTFGPRQSARAVIPAIITQVSMGKNPIKLGSLVPRRDFTYVKDMVNGFIKVSENDTTGGEVINIGIGTAISIGELVDVIGKILGIKIEVKTDKERIRPQKSEVLQLVCDNTKMHKLTGWKPEFSLEKGLLETIGYIKTHISFYKSDIYNV